MDAHPGRRLALAALAVALASPLAACMKAEPCPGPLTLCGGACVDASTDRINCGACGVVCGAGSVCAAGRCVLDPVAPCPIRSGGAFVTFGGVDACSGTVKMWATEPTFIADAEALVAGGTGPAVPLLELRNGADCDAQWSFHVDPTDPLFVQGPISTDCDKCPDYVQANLAAMLDTATRQWCPSSLRVLEVDRRP